MVPNPSDPAAADRAPGAGAAAAYRERLVPSPGVVAAVLLLAPALLAALLPVSLPFAVVAAIVVTAAVEASLVLAAPVLAVRGGELSAGRAHIPVALLRAATAHRGAEATAERGVRLDARAWTLIRGWVGPVARVELTDPDDPAPYWLLSTRHPERLAAAIEAERTR